jgi:hypothetical protein
MIYRNVTIDTTNLVDSLTTIVNETASEVANIPSSWDEDKGVNPPIGGASKLLRLCKDAARLLDEVRKFGRVSEGTMSGPPYA